MNNEYSKIACETEHRRIDERLNHHESWLGEHETKIDRLDRSDATNTQAIDNLCKQIGGLTKAIWGLITIGATAFTGFFFYAVQNNIFGK
jgi:hypothetical protein